MSCACEGVHSHCRFVAITGGPSAGKTALLEVVRRHFCAHVGVLPEAASIVFGGGFPRGADKPTLVAGQRAIYAMQVELHRWAKTSRRHAVVLCDRGTLDGLAYWPGAPEAFFAELDTSQARELARYDRVIHLHTPAASGYDSSNPLRIESHEAAVALDEGVMKAWRGHPQRVVIPQSKTFLEKMVMAIAAVREAVPECCRAHVVPHLDHPKQ